MSKRAQLLSHPFMRGLSEAQVDQLVPCARTVSCPAGAFLFRESGDANALYLILHGHIVLEQYLPGKGALPLESLVGGDIVGLSWMLPGGHWILDARAVEPTEAVALNAPCLQSRMDEDAALGYALSKRLIQQLYQRLERTRLQRLDVYGAER